MSTNNGLSVKLADMIIKQSDPEGYHPQLLQRWAYVPGMMLMAIARVSDKTGDSKYNGYMKKHMDLFVELDGRIRTYVLEDYNLDQINQGKNLFKLWKQTGERQYAQAAHLLAAQLAGQPRTCDGGFWHKKIYPFQMWLDGLYMAAPFLAEYASVFEKPELFDEVALQLLLVEKHTRDRTSGLLYHGWDECREQIWCNPVSGQSANFWSRALGWYVMAVVDALEHFPLNHPKRGTIAGIFERLCNALCKVRDPETGLWYLVMDQGQREGNYLEASGSAMIIYAMAKGARLGYLTGKFKAVAEQSYSGLLSRLVTEEEETASLHQICHGAGLSDDRDGSYEYYINEPISRDIHIGLAPLLLTCVEMEGRSG